MVINASHCDGGNCYLLRKLTQARRKPRAGHARLPRKLTPDEVRVLGDQSAHG
jgi:hypothetical protein